MQVGEVLHLGNRDQSGEAGAQPKAENGLLVQQCVEHSSRAMCAGQTCGDAIDAALDADVLTENDHSTIGGQQLIERGIDRLGECARPGWSTG